MRGSEVDKGAYVKSLEEALLRLNDLYMFGDF